MMNENQKKELDNLLFNDSFNTRFGCVLFDLQEDKDGKMIPWPGTGWASLEGKTAVRIRSTGDLSSDVKWWTNLPHELFWKSGAVKQPKLKYSSYVRTDMGQIMKELGLNPQKMTTSRVCEILSELFTKIMKLAVEFYNVREFNESDLIAEIKKTLISSDNNISMYVDEALTRAYQDIVICEKDLSNNDVRYITLKRPRYVHAQRILETTVPLFEGDWDFKGEDDLPSDFDERIEYILSLDKPFVAKVSINSFKSHDGTDVDLSKLLNMGEAIGEKGKKKDRNWVSQPEFIYLAKFANIHVDALFLAKGYKNIEMKYPLIDLGGLSPFSYSIGILSECVWVSLSSRSINPQTRAKTLVSPRACWIKATDRFLTFTSAMMLAASGFNVISYGFGGVTVAIADRQIKKLIEIAPHAGLVLPLSIFEKSSFLSS